MDQSGGYGAEWSAGLRRASDAELDALAAWLGLERRANAE